MVHLPVNLRVFYGLRVLRRYYMVKLPVKLQNIFNIRQNRRFTGNSPGNFIAISSSVELHVEYLRFSIKLILPNEAYLG